MKKTISMLTRVFVFIVLVSSLQVMPAFAKDDGSKNVSSHHAKAHLKNLTTNEIVDLPVTLTEDIANSSASAQMAVMAGMFNSESHGKYDTTLAVKVTVKMDFYEQNSGNDWLVDLDRGFAYFEKYDNTVTIINAVLTNAVMAQEQNGHWDILTDPHTIGTPNLNSWYAWSPPWAGTYVICNDTSNQSVVVNSTISRGGSNWSLSLCVAQGGGTSTACE